MNASQIVKIQLWVTLWIASTWGRKQINNSICSDEGETKCFQLSGFLPSSTARCRSPRRMDDKDSPSPSMLWLRVTADAEQRHLKRQERAQPRQEREKIQT